MSAKVILLEFNELCPPLLDKFIRQGELPNFARLYQQGQCYLTDADCDTDYLEPWIQWVTLHTGQPYEKHQVFRLGQAQHLACDNIWDILSRHNKRSWLCGSMNAKWDPADNNIIALPDPWSVDLQASPASLNTFYHFVRANVQEHTNENFRLATRDYLAFITFMARHGLSAATLMKAAGHVLKQLRRAPDRWKKATLLDWLQLDVFRYVYRRQQPDFATFFSNSVAHFQHKFWRYMEPDKFPLKPSADEIARYGNAILYAYRNHDALIGEIFKLADANTTIILASALSQQPYTLKDEEGGKRFYRPHDIQQLPALFNLEGVDKISPVMSHQFHIFCRDEAAAKTNFDKLSKATVNSHPLFSLRLEGSDVFGGCAIIQPLTQDQPICYGDNQQLNFFDVFYLADSLKSGCHHPHGVFWLYRPGRQGRQVTEPIPLPEATAHILDEFGLASALPG